MSQQTLKNKRPLPAEEKPYHHGDLRNALIASGLAVLAEQGADALNLREVARRAGVSHAAPYRHFADKTTLIEAIAEDGFHRLWAALEKADAKPAKDASQKLIALGLAYVRFALEHADHFRVMFTSARNPHANPRLYVESKAGFYILIGALQAGQASGELVQDDPLDQAKALWAAMHGIAVLMIDNQFADAGPDRAKYADALVKRSIEQMLAGLRRPGKR